MRVEDVLYHLKVKAQLWNKVSRYATRSKPPLDPAILRRWHAFDTPQTKPQRMIKCKLPLQCEEHPRPYRQQQTVCTRGVLCNGAIHSQSGWSSFSNNKSKLPPSSRLIPGYKLIDIPPSGRLLWGGWLKNRSCHFWHLERYICIPPAAVSNSGFKYVGIFGRLGSNQT